MPKTGISKDRKVEQNRIYLKQNLEQNGYFNNNSLRLNHHNDSEKIKRTDILERRISLTQTKNPIISLPFDSTTTNLRSTSRQEDDDDNNSVFLSPEKSDTFFRNNYVNTNNLIYKKSKKKLPKNQKLISLNNPNVLQANCVNLNHLNNFNHHLNPNHHLNNHINRLNSGQFILTEHSITVMEEESTDDEKSNGQETLYNDLNRITIDAHENRYQYLHQQHFHQQPDFHQQSDDKTFSINDERLISPKTVQPKTTMNNTTAALIAIQQQKQLQQQQIQQRKEQCSKYIRNRSSVDALNGLIFVLSAIYAKLVVILGLCFPMAEVISHRIPIGWYEGFYLYLYLGSVFFLATIYMSRESSKHKLNTFGRIKKILFWSNVEPEHKHGNTLIHENSFSSNYTLGASGNISVHSSCSESDSFSDHGKPTHYGSFYLRLGAVAFGIGSMIYSGLEFGQFFELENKEQCYSFLLMILPTSHMVFTFFQLYFIFMNSKSLIMKHRYFARFGLMHMIATNLCVWLHVLIQETKHQIMILFYPNRTHDLLMRDNFTSSGILLSPLPTFSTFLTPFNNNLSLDAKNLSPSILSNSDSLFNQKSINSSSTTHKLIKRSIEDHEIFTTHGICRRSNVIGQLVQDASQFLFPCTIEYSLICAAILYIMWKSTDFSTSHGKLGSSSENRLRHRSAASSSTVNYQHPKHYYQVDCAKSVKGLFCGIFILVVCIISLILFFVLIKKPNYKNLGIFQAHVVEIILYVINAIACLIAIIQIKELPYNRERNVELDNILLIVAQFGLYLFNGFSLIGAHFYHDSSKSSNSNTQLVKIGAIVCLIQATLQTVFILDATKRTAFNSDQIKRKPGREMVTFLLVCNFSMWSINTLETRRSESTPVQLNFYGKWGWTVFTHITAPLTIFFRFHSTVCLCDIWKRNYKANSENILR